MTDTINANSNNSSGGCGCLPLILVLFAWYFSQWPFLSGDFNPLRFESKYNVYFYYPTGKEVNLGVADSLERGQFMAVAEADRLGFRASSGWDYILCKITRTSQCQTKHK